MPSYHFVLLSMTLLASSRCQQAPPVAAITLDSVEVQGYDDLAVRYRIRGLAPGALSQTGLELYREDQRAAEPPLFKYLGPRTDIDTVLPAVGRHRIFFIRAFYVLGTDTIFSARQIVCTRGTRDRSRRAGRALPSRPNMEARPSPGSRPAVQRHVGRTTILQRGRLHP